MSKKKPFKLLCLFDYKAQTGFATVSQNIMKRLKKHYGGRLLADIIAINFFEDNLLEYNGEISVISAIKFEEANGKDDKFGRNVFLKMLQEHDYDGVFIIHDPGTLRPIIPLLKEIKQKKKENNKKQFKSIYYFPLDGPSLSHWFDGFDFFDTLVTYTEFAKWEMRGKRPEFTNVKVIPHGVNLKDFFPLPDAEKKEFREAYFGENSKKTIIANINRNQPRKDIPTTIFAFQKYRENHNPNSLLYLHMDPMDTEGWRLLEVLQYTDLKIGVDVMFPTSKINEIDPGYLNCIYNACDCFLNTTSGEGWGLSVTEAFATKLPVIAPYHTSLMEIGGSAMSREQQRMWFLYDLHSYCTHFDNIIRWQVDAYEAASTLKEATISYTDKTKNYVENAYAYAQSISWDNVCRQWIGVFEKYF